MSKKQEAKVTVTGPNCPYCGLPIAIELSKKTVKILRKGFKTGKSPRANIRVLGNTEIMNVVAEPLKRAVKVILGAKDEEAEESKEND